jgi:hypothetical protein
LLTSPQGSLAALVHKEADAAPDINSARHILKQVSRKKLIPLPQPSAGWIILGFFGVFRQKGNIPPGARLLENVDTQAGISRRCTHGAPANPQCKCRANFAVPYIKGA